MRRRVLWAVLGTAGLLGVGVSGLARARETTRQQGDLSQVRSLLVVLRLYAYDHGGALPDDLGVLFEQGYCGNGRIYVTPGSRTAPPATAAEVRAGQCDYLYFGKGLRLDTCSPDRALLMTQPGTRRYGYVSIGYAGGRFVGRCDARPLGSR